MKDYRSLQRFFAVLLIVEIKGKSFKNHRVSKLCSIPSVANPTLFADDDLNKMKGHVCTERTRYGRVFDQKQSNVLDIMLDSP